MQMIQRQDPHVCIFRASKTRIAFRRFPFESSTIFSPASGGRSNPARLATYFRTVNICQHKYQCIWRCQGSDNSDIPLLHWEQLRALIGIDSWWVQLNGLYYWHRELFAYSTYISPWYDAEQLGHLGTGSRLHWWWPLNGEKCLKGNVNVGLNYIPLNRCFALRSTCWVCAISLSNSWMTTRS